MTLLTLYLEVSERRIIHPNPKYIFPATRSAHSKLRSKALQRCRLFSNVTPAAKLATATRMFAQRCLRWRPLASAQSHPSISPALSFAQYIKIIKMKRKHVDTEPETPSPPAGEPLSPQQLDRIARNKKAALDRLSAAQTPVGFGESWKSGLSAEFGKPYFKQVRILTPHDAARLCPVPTLTCWAFFTADELCC